MKSIFIQIYYVYYTYLEKTGSYYLIAAESLKYNGEYNHSDFIKIIDDINYEDKDWFVRQYIMSLDVMLSYYK